jgi:hypothetical protein
MDALTYTPNPIRLVAERVADDFAAFCYDGFGVWLSDEQLAAHDGMRGFGPRVHPDEAKFHFVSGGTRGGKTVLLALGHADTCMYKRGVDGTDHTFWANYLYKTLSCAPTTELSLKLWQVMNELSKGANDAQYDRKARRARGGAFLHLLAAGTANQWPIVRYENGARTDFRSTEGWAYRLEGDQWWLFTWDEWASQPDREIDFVLTDVLQSRSRDHDAKIIPAAWPKEATEHHLIKQIRRVEQGATDTAIHYISSEAAYFTNQTALATEKARKSKASYLRTVLGRPAGGSGIEFKLDVVEHATNSALPPSALPTEQDWIEHRFLSAWDLGLAHDSTVGLTFRVPKIGVTTRSKARIVNSTEIVGSETQTLDSIAFAIHREQMLYRGQSAIDASGLGGIAAVRQLRDLRPGPLSFVARSNDRIWGNMRLAAITNGLDMLTWGRPENPDEDDAVPWGLIEMPYLTKLIDQLANFDRDAKNVPDDWVWSFLIGLWYIRRYWVVGKPPHRAVPFDPRPTRRRAVPMRR